eukprot:UN25317
MDYRRQTDFSPSREVSIFVLQNKKWVDVFSGSVSFIYDFQLQEFRVAFKLTRLSDPHVYTLQSKIRKKGAKAFVIRANNIEIGDCILAFRFENDTDSLNFQFFMEQRTPNKYE